MSWTNPKFERIYNREKEQAVSNKYSMYNLTEEDLSSNYLDGELFRKTTKNELIAYERGILRGIKLVDNMLTPIRMDPLECPEIRFQIVVLYAVKNDEDYIVSEDFNKIQKENPNKQIFVGWGIWDALMNKKADNTETIYFLKQDAEKVKKEILKQI